MCSTTTAERGRSESSNERLFANRVDQLLREPRSRELLCARFGSTSDPLSERWIREVTRDPFGQRLAIAERDEEAVDAVGDDLLRAALGTCDERLAERHGFE